MKLTVLLTVPCLLLAACIPVPTAQLKVTAPEVHGRIVDESTHQPVAGAEVSFEGQSSHVTSAPDGSFTLRRQRDLVLMKVFTPCPVYDFPEPRRLPGAVTVGKQGYDARTVELRPYYQRLAPVHGNENWKASPWEDPTIDLGEVSLAPR